MLHKFKKQFYFFPGILVSALISFSPSFRLSTILVNFLFKNSKIASSVTIHHKVRFLMPRNLIVGEGSTINSHCLLDTRNMILIGRHVMVAHDTKIFTLGHDYNSKDFAGKGGEVTIEDDVIIFPDVRIMPNTRIGKGAVILNSTIVTKDVPSMAIVGGNPGKVIGERKQTHEHPFSYRSYYAL